MENAMRPGAEAAPAPESQKPLEELAEMRHEELRALRTDMENTEHLLPQVKNPDALRGFEEEIFRLRARVDQASDDLHKVERDLPAAA
jgi:hypothetical protein